MLNSAADDDDDVDEQRITSSLLWSDDALELSLYNTNIIIMTATGSQLSLGPEVSSVGETSLQGLREIGCRAAGYLVSNLIPDVWISYQTLLCGLKNYLKIVR